MLHITNGDSVVAGFRAASLAGEFLAWRDPLHDGPVPAAPDLPALSAIRAQALADFGWGTMAALCEDFAQRDATLLAFREHDEVVLWFEHDLYDQLQLLQLLAFFHSADRGDTRLSLIELDRHPEVVPFYGLGQLNARQLTELLPGRVPVSDARLEHASRQWRVFTSDCHTELRGFDRLLEEYPGVNTGLSRTERQLLLAARSGARSRAELYREANRCEEVPWGDSSVFLRMDGLSSGPDPALVQTATDSFALSATGEAILAGERDWLNARGGADTWLGGVHLTGLQPKWRWDSQASLLRPQTQ